MEKINIEINTGNAAFEDERELPRVLRELAIKFELGSEPKILKDLNGNKVGTISYE